MFESFEVPGFLISYLFYYFLKMLRFTAHYIQYDIFSLDIHVAKDSGQLSATPWMHGNITLSEFYHTWRQLPKML